MPVCLHPALGPLATLAGVYHDVKGQRLEEMWSEAVLSWINKMEDLLAVLRENHQPRAFSPAGVALIRAVLDVVGNYTHLLIETILFLCCCSILIIHLEQQ